MLRSITSLTDVAPRADDDGQLAALREQISALTSEVAEVAERRLQQARAAADAGANLARDRIDAFPLTSVVLAFGAGAVLGLALLPKQRKTLDWRHASASDIKDEIADYTEQMKRQLRRSMSGNAVANRFEQMAESVSQVDAKATLAPVLNRLMTWAEGLKDRASTAASDVAKRVAP